VEEPYHKGQPEGCNKEAMIKIAKILREIQQDHLDREDEVQ